MLFTFFTASWKNNFLAPTINSQSPFRALKSGANLALINQDLTPLDSMAFLTFLIHFDIKGLNT